MANLVLVYETIDSQEQIQFLDNMYIYTKFECACEKRTVISQKYSGLGKTRETLIGDYLSIGYLTKEQIRESLGTTH